VQHETNLVGLPVLQAERIPRPWKA